MFNIFKKSSTKPVNLFFKTDIHCHLIPGIDDGAAEAAEGALLVEREKGWGIERIISTPHNCILYTSDAADDSNRV